MEVALCIYLSSLVSTMTPVYLWEVLTLDITRGPRPLIDHLTTVSAYFNDHKSQANQKIQDDYFRKFTCYLLPTCWLKDVKRIGSWQAMVASTNCGKDSTISIAMMKANLRITLPASNLQYPKHSRNFTLRTLLLPSTLASPPPSLSVILTIFYIDSICLYFNSTTTFFRDPPSFLFFSSLCGTFKFSENLSSFSHCCCISSFLAFFLLLTFNTFPAALISSLSMPTLFCTTPTCTNIIYWFLINFTSKFKLY